MHKHRKRKNVSLNSLIAFALTAERKRKGILRQMPLEIVVDVITRFLAFICEFFSTFHHVMQWRRSHFIIHQLSPRSAMNLTLSLTSITHSNFQLPSSFTNCTKFKFQNHFSTCPSWDVSFREELMRNWKRWIAP